ncbi:MAG: amino acid adenylation domain-containing protein [Acidobacteriota bacterium]
MGLLEELGRLDVGIAAAGGKLRLRARQGVLTPQLQEQLRDLRADLLALLDPPPGPRAEVGEADAPLSAAQRQLWLHQQSHPESSAYHIPLMLRLRGPLPVAVLEAALGLLIQRHESLRTVYSSTEKGPRQQVTDGGFDGGSDGLCCCDLSALSPRVAEIEEGRRLTAWAGRAFDLESAPPIRLLLLRRSATEHVLAVVVHHIAADGLSLQIVLEELDRAWGPLERGELPVLRPLELRYADFARWQQRHGQQKEVEERLALWKGELEGARPPALPYDRSSPEGGPGPAITVIEPFPEGAVLLALGRRAGATGFATALGLVSVLLARLGGTRDVVVGTPVAGRPDPALQRVVGLFADLLPLRLNLPPGASLAEILSSARREVAQAESRVDLPADRLSPPPAALARAVLVGGGAAPPASTLGGLSIEPIPVEATAAKFDLTFGMALDGAAPELSAELDGERFDSATGVRLLRTLRLLARRALAQPTRGWDELPLLSAAERHAVLHEWSAGEGTREGTREGVDGPPLIHRAILARAAAQPQRPAVVAEGEAWTYGELLAAASRLAARLRAAGVSPEGRVAVLLPRGAAQIAACLGSILAGASYLPLDPGHPEARLEYLLRDSRAEALVAESDRPTPGDVDLPRFAPPSRGPAAAPPANPPAESEVVGAVASRPMGPEDPERIAALIYTSGSSGQPKGVMVRHGGLAALTAWQGRCSSLAPGGRVTHLAGLAFDAAAWEVWTALTHGATLIVPGEEERTDPGRLGPLLKRLEPAWSWVPTALIEVLLTRGEAMPKSGLWTGGDRLRQRPNDPRSSLFNAYGPTETTVVATAGAVAVGREIRRLPSLGRPAAAGRIFVVDHRLRPLPPGFEGELVIGGGGVSRGYLGRPGRTAEVFVPDSLTGTFGGRLYRSGDRVRQRADGRFDFLSRLDFQMEVRGLRIEPGEVESALSAHPEVRQVAVAAPKVAGESVLTAWVVGEAAWVVGEAAEDDLRQWAAERLPAGLCPAAYVPMETLPLNRNGKVDREALPLPEVSVRPAQDLLEEQLVKVWEQVLGRPAGRDTDLFAAGGSSLSALQATALLGTTLGRTVSLEEMLRSRTPMALAERIRQDVDEVAALEDRQEEGQEGGAGAAGIRRTSPGMVPFAAGQTDAPLSAAQRQLWLHQRSQPESSAYHIPLMLRLRGDLSVAVLDAALGLLIQRHDSLRTVYSSTEQGPWQQVTDGSFDGGSDGLCCCDLSGLPPRVAEIEEVRRLSAWARRPFDLESASPIRLLLLRRCATEHVLAVVVHHIAADGLSLQIVLEELDRAWGPLERGELPVLRPLELRYGDFARWQQQHGQRPEVEERLALWQGELEGARPPALPYDRPAPEGGPGPAITVRQPFPEGAALLALGRRAGATEFATALGLVSVLLARLGGTRDVVVGTPVAGRPDPALQRVVGLFADLLPLRVTLPPGAGLAEVLSSAWGEVTQAASRGDLPLDRLSPPPAALARAVLVDGGGAAPSAATLGGLPMEPISVESSAAKFDITLGVALDGAAPELSAELDGERFDRSTGARLLRILQLLARRAIAEPARGWDELPLLSAAERHAVLHEWSARAGAGEVAREGTKEGVDGPPLIHRAILARGSAEPQRPALVAEGAAWTYGELLAAASRLAARLRAAGVSPEGRVAVLLPRGAAQIASCLGSILAGASYLPLDPGHPEVRLEFLLRDSRAEALVTGPDRPTPGGLDLPRLAAPSRDPGASPEAKGELAPRFVGPDHPERIAALIYTSGSSGQPKGVMVRHGGLAALTAWQGRCSDLAPGDRVTHLAGLAFDAAAWEVWTALTHGATLIVPGEKERTDPERLGPLLKRLEPAWSWVPTALVEVLLTRDEAMPTSGLWTGGDRLRQRPKDSRSALFNAYGPTETTVVATAGAVEAGPEIRRLPSLGRPAAASRIFVVDHRLRPLPPGFEGELVIGGGGVSRGYSGRPGRTAEVFVPDPLTGTFGGRLYRSGDRVRQRADGRFDFLSRLDFQLEVRGQRIEPGEVESALSAHPEVRQVAVAAPKVAGESVLSAWVVGEAAEDDLRQWAAERLPAGLCPAAYVPMETLPLNRNGKMDREALPLPEVAVRPARDLLEEQLVKVWEQVLERPAGRDTDLFAAGGSSLSALQATALLGTTVGRTVSVEEVLRSRTPMALAERIRQTVGEEDGREAGRSAAGIGITSPGVVPFAAGQTDAPLSAAQRQLWLHQRSHPESTAYHIPLMLRLLGDLPVAVLDAALGLLIQRHESLRTVYSSTEKGPRQEAMDGDSDGGSDGGFDDGSDGLGCCDLSALPPAVAEIEEGRRLSAWAGRPFDLERAPPIRLLLLRRSATEHVLAVVVHHIAADGLSLQIVLEELDRVWGPLERGELPVLHPLELRYGDFARWQQQHGQRPEVEERLALWQGELEGARPPALPYDRPSPEGGPGSAITVREPFPEGGALLALGRRVGATEFATALGLVSVLLARLGGTRDVVVGTPVAGRPDPALQRVVGLFADLLPLRLTLPPGASLTEVLSSAWGEVTQAASRGDLPLDRLSPPPAALARAVLVDGGAASPAATLGGLPTEPISVVASAAKFDLTFGVILDGAAPELFAELDGERFDGSTGVRLLRTLRLLTRRALAEPARGWDELPLLSAAERHAVLHEWSAKEGARESVSEGAREGAREGASAAADGPPLIHRAILARGAAEPERPAVVAEGETWTYGELLAAASRIAAQLRAAGVSPEGRVAVLLPRGAAQIAACLGSILAGASYLPLDPGHPEVRLEFLLQDSRAEALVVERDRPTPGGLDLPRLAAPVRGPGASPEAEGEPACRSVGPDHPERIAALIYTSGSSGQPKGVMVRHGGLAALTAWQGRCSDLAPGDRVTHLAGLAFDAAAWEVWTALTHGATLIVPSGQDRTDPSRLGPLLKDLEPAWSWVPTALMEVLLTRDEAMPKSGLWTGGDRLRQRPKDPGSALFNAYGPTETTVVATAGAVEAGAEIRPLPSLGRPAAASRIFVVDRHLKPLPPGFEGELVIGGDGVSRGYSGRPGRTAEVFVPDSLTGAFGGRLYRSGDRVRQRADGRFEFLARLDFQLEVRGLRIEPGEVESALSAHPEVRQVAVAAPKVAGESVLTAWVVGEAAWVVGEAAWVVGEAAEDDLRQWAAERLPAGLCPAAYVWMETLPLNRNGKVDREALPLPEIAVRPPRGLLEEQLVKVWERVLQRPAGRDTDLFAAGGSSLSALRVAALVGSMLGRTVTVEEVLRSRTPMALAAALRQEAREEAALEDGREDGHPDGQGAAGISMTSPPVVPLSEGEGTPLFVVHPPAGGVADYFPLAEHLAETVPVHGLVHPWLAESPPSDVGLRADHDLAAAHAATIRAAVPGGPRVLGGWSAGGLLAFEVARRLGAAASGLLLLDAPAPGMLSSFHEKAMKPGARRGAESEKRLLAAFAVSLLGPVVEELPQSPTGGTWDAFVALARRFDVLSEEAEAEAVLRLRFEAFCDTLRAVAGEVEEVQKGPLDLPTILVVARSGASARRDLAQAWRRWVSPLEVLEVGTDHFGVLKPDALAEVAGSLNRRLPPLFATN